MERRARRYVVCIMIVCIVFTIPNVLLLIANENKPYFGGKTEDRDTG